MLEDTKVRTSTEALYEEYDSVLRRASGNHGSVCEEEHSYADVFVKRYFPRDTNLNILEVGCGNGSFLSALSRMGYSHLRGIDISPEQVRLARARGLTCVEQGDLGQALPKVSSYSVDILIALDVLEHLEPRSIITTVDQMRRTLKPNGLLVLNIPNAVSPFFGRIRYGDITHFTAFTAQSISQLLYTVGFSDVQCHENAPLVHGPKSALRAVLWKAIRQFLVFYIAVETGAWNRKQVFSQNMLVLART
jgi:2-polyprenyl-3-methyl-5-hydroxy-6-metoxy-1,4-benzoquinol methylase